VAFVQEAEGFSQDSAGGSRLEIDRSGTYISWSCLISSLQPPRRKEGRGVRWGALRPRGQLSGILGGSSDGADAQQGGKDLDPSKARPRLGPLSSMAFLPCHCSQIPSSAPQAPEFLPANQTSSLLTAARRQWPPPVPNSATIPFRGRSIHLKLSIKSVIHLLAQSAVSFRS